MQRTTVWRRITPAIARKIATSWNNISVNLWCPRSRSPQPAYALEMGNDPAAEVGAANARFRHIHGLKLEHAVAFEDVEGVPEGADHGVVADTVHIFKARHSGHGDAQRSPVFAAEVAVDGERK